MAAAPASYETAGGQPIEFFVVGGNLPPKATTFVVANLKDRTSDVFTEISRTEIIRENAAPQFQHRFTMDYFFEEEQFIRCDLYQVRARPVEDLALQEHVGSITFKLGDVLHAPSMMVTRGIYKEKVAIQLRGKAQTLAVHAELSASGSDVVTLSFAGENLKKMDMFGKSDPFYEIFRVQENGYELLVHRSPTIQKTLNPEWPVFETTTGQLCNGDYDRNLIIRVWDEDRGDQREEIGFCTMNLREMMDGSRRASLRRDNGKDKTYGELIVRTCEVSRQAGFLDYLQGGCDISCMFAIDFTNSNLKSSKPESLHYINGWYEQGVCTQYQWALRSIGTVIAPYDADQMFPVFGFGAKLRREDDQANQCFSLNYTAYGHNPDPFVPTIAGVEAAYLQSLGKYVDSGGKKQKYFYFSGPTHFAPILARANEIAAHANAARAEKQQYFILVILTDGMVEDLQATKDQIVRAANEFLPLSIVIVGIENAADRATGNTFDRMVELDADRTPLVDSNGNRAVRDIVQFVEMKQVLGDPSALSKATLSEVPAQFLSYMRAVGLQPGPGRPVPPAPVAPPEYFAQQVPPPSNQQPEPPLPYGWEKCFDANGRPYYVDHNTQRTYEVHPAYHGGELPAAGGAAAAAPVEAAPVQAAPQTQAEPNPFDLFMPGGQ